MQMPKYEAYKDSGVDWEREELEKLQKTGADWQRKVLERLDRLVKAVQQSLRMVVGRSCGEDLAQEIVEQVEQLEVTQKEFRSVVELREVTSE